MREQFLFKIQAVRSLIVTISLCLCVNAARVEAHPHVWITVQISVLLEHDAIVGLRHTWQFDKDYLAGALTDYDSNRDGKLSAEELTPLRASSMAVLAEYQFFTIANTAEQPIKLLPANDLTITQRDDRLEFHFTIRLAKPLPKLTAEFRFEVYDPTFYSAFAFATSEPIGFDGSSSASCSAVIVLDPAGAQQKLIKTFMRQVGRATAPVPTAKTIVVSCPS